MTKMKLCGLFRPCDIDAANELKPEYIGFVFAPKSRRYVTPEEAAELKKLLAPTIQAVGVFVNEAAERIDPRSGSLSGTGMSLPEPVVADALVRHAGNGRFSAVSDRIFDDEKGGKRGALLVF